MGVLNIDILLILFAREPDLFRVQFTQHRI